MTVGDFGIEPWPEARELHFTLEDGHITAITLTGTIENVEEGVDTPNGLVPRIVMSLAWGREEASFWSLARQAQMTELERRDWSKDFVIHFLHLHRGPGQRMTGSKTARRGDLSVPCR